MWKTLIADLVTKDKIIRIAVAILLSLGTLYGVYKTARGAEYNDLIVEYKEQTVNSKKDLADCIEDLNEAKMIIFRYELEDARRNDFVYTSIKPKFVKKVLSKYTPPIMHYMNFRYANRYIASQNKNPDDYLGKTDIEFWGEEIGSKFLELDMKIIRDKVGEDILVPDPSRPGKMARVILDPILYDNEVIRIEGTVITDL